MAAGLWFALELTISEQPRPNKGFEVVTEVSHARHHPSMADLAANRAVMQNVVRRCYQEIWNEFKPSVDDEFRGIHGTNRKFAYPGVGIFKILGGKIVDCWVVGTHTACGL